MAALYVSYTASRDHDTSVAGWCSLRNTAVPQTSGEVEAICKKIADLEGIEHVCPVFWAPLPDCLR